MVMTTLIQEAYLSVCITVLSSCPISAIPLTLIVDLLQSKTPRGLFFLGLNSACSLQHKASLRPDRLQWEQLFVVRAELCPFRRLLLVRLELGEEVEFQDVRLLSLFFPFSLPSR